MTCVPFSVAEGTEINCLPRSILLQHLRFLDQQGFPEANHSPSFVLGEWPPCGKQADPLQTVIKEPTPPLRLLNPASIWSTPALPLFGTTAHVNTLKLAWVHCLLYLFYSLPFNTSISLTGILGMSGEPNLLEPLPQALDLKLWLYTISCHLVSSVHRDVLLKFLYPSMSDSCRKLTGGKTRVGATLRAWMNLCPRHCPFLWLIHSCRNHSLVF